MNDSQSQQNTGGSDLSATQNPQAIPTQNLGSSDNNLQTSTSDLLSQNGLKISGVNSSNPQTLSSSKTLPNTSAEPITSSILPAVIGFAIVMIVLISLAALAIKKSQVTEAPVEPPKKKTNKTKKKSKRSKSKSKV